MPESEVDGVGSQANFVVWDCRTSPLSPQYSSIKFKEGMSQNSPNYTFFFYTSHSGLVGIALP